MLKRTRGNFRAGKAGLSWWPRRLAKSLGRIVKVVLMGNAGAGKTTLSRALMAGAHVPRLSLDEVAFSEGTERRPLADSISDVLEFTGSHENWIIKGCYADIIGPVLEHRETLVFLNPGVATCIEHCRSRPWEPEKFASASEQERNLENLIAWVSEYESRSDEYGLKQYRRLFDSFSGRKFEFTSVVPDAAQQIVAAGQMPLNSGVLWHSQSSNHPINVKGAPHAHKKELHSALGRRAPAR